MTTGNLSPLPWLRFCDNNGRPLANGRLHTYQAGTTTPTPTYTDSTFSQANTNPMILNARGEASVWLVEGQFYKFVLEDAQGYPLWTQDQIAADAPLGYTPVKQGGTTQITLTWDGTGVDVTVGTDDLGHIVFQSDLTTINNEIATLTGQVDNLNNEMAAVQGELSTIEGEIAALQGQLGSGPNLPAGFDPLAVNGIGYVISIWVGYDSTISGGTWPAEGSTVSFQGTDTGFGTEIDMTPWGGSYAAPSINTGSRPGTWMASGNPHEVDLTAVDFIDYYMQGLFVRVA